MNFREWIERKAAWNGGNSCLIYKESEVSYQEFDKQINRAAHMFYAMGVRKGDKVAIVMKNCPEYLYGVFGLAKIGAIAACTNIHMRGEGLRYLIDSSDVKIVTLDRDLQTAYEDVEPGLKKIEKVVWNPSPPSNRGHETGLEDALRSSPDEPVPNVEVKKGDPFVFMHTGGTTGPPKWCINSHNFHIKVAEQLSAYMGVLRSDRLFNPLPLFHLNPFSLFAMTGLAGNATLVMTDRFSASGFWDFVVKHGITVLVLHGGVVEILKKQPFTLAEKAHRVRTGFRIQDKEFLERFNIPSAVGGYGSTEAGGVTTLSKFFLPLGNRYDHLQKLSQFCGKCRDDMQLRIADEEDNEVRTGEVGEILIRSEEPDVIFSGYYNMPERTVHAFRNQWFHTGDLGYVDKEGNLYFVQRKAESIRIKGEWVHIEEVEQTISSHPAVAECAVVGIPGGLEGDEVKAVIKLKENAIVTPEQILSYCEGKLAYFMIPRFIEFIDELPRTDVTGRIMKTKLKESGKNKAWDREASGYKLQRR